MEPHPSEPGAEPESEPSAEPEAPAPDKDKAPKCAELKQSTCKVTKGCAWNSLGKCVEEDDEN
jgi:hypothetical protein